MAVTGIGRVGIGTIAPTDLLTVNGTAGDIVFLTTDPSDSTTIAQPPREVVRIKATGEISASAYIGPIDGGTY